MLRLVCNHWIVIQISVCIYSHLIFYFCDLHIFRLSIFKFYLSLHSSRSKTLVVVVLLFCNCRPLPMKETIPLRVIFFLFLWEIYYSLISIVGTSSIIWFDGCTISIFLHNAQWKMHIVHKRIKKKYWFSITQPY